MFEDRVKAALAATTHGRELDYVLTRCMAFSTNASMSRAGRAPAVRAISRPPQRPAIVGIDRMPNRSPRSLRASVLTFTTR